LLSSWANQSQWGSGIEERDAVIVSTGKKLAKTFPFRVSSLTILKKKINVLAIETSATGRSFFSHAQRLSRIHGSLNGQLHTF
jgi:hypothetical protein